MIKKASERPVKPFALIRARKDAGLTQEKLARKVGYSTGDMISRVETGKMQPSVEKLVSLGKVLGVPLEVLCEGPRAPVGLHQKLESTPDHTNDSSTGDPRMESGTMATKVDPEAAINYGMFFTCALSILDIQRRVNADLGRGAFERAIGISEFIPRQGHDELDDFIETLHNTALSEHERLAEQWILEGHPTLFSRLVGEPILQPDDLESRTFEHYKEMACRLLSAAKMLQEARGFTEQGLFDFLEAHVREVDRQFEDWLFGRNQAG